MLDLRSDQQQVLIEQFGQNEKEGDKVMKSLKDYITQQLLPIKKALNIIFSKLNIKQSFFIPEELHITNHKIDSSLFKRSTTKGHRKMKKAKKNNVTETQKQKDDNQIKDQSLSLSLESQSLDQFHQQIKQIQYATPLPRGNNTAFNPIPLPRNAYMQQVKPQNRQEWAKIYNRVKRLLQSKKAKGQRGWFDFQKKILLQFVTIGTQFGINPVRLTQQLGVSHSSFKRWRRYFK